MIVATAGHIDHGKTALVQALTGVDADRLAEEKRRGMTIDLGFAYQEVEGASVLGFVDVPGHERFVRNMVAGVTGVDFALLVVAADDGLMPQTLEHVDIIDLVGLEHGAVALTKTDLVSDERAREVADEIAAHLATTSLAGAPVFPVSSRTGEGIEALKVHLHAHLNARAKSAAARGEQGHFRLAIDRVFTLSGVGIVVTGAVFSGRVALGEQLLLSPSDIPVRVRGLRAQGREVTEAQAGVRAAVNIAGRGVETSDIRRGDWLVAGPAHAPTGKIDAHVRVVAGEERVLAHWTPVHLHLATEDVPARVAVLEGASIAPGQSGLVRLVLDRAIGALAGDRFILRDQSARRTIAGGHVVDPFPPRRGRARPERLLVLRALDCEDHAAAFKALIEASPDGVDLNQFSLARNLTKSEAEQLFDAAEMIRLGGFAVSHAHFAALKERIVSRLQEFHAAQPDRLGPDIVRLARLLGGRVDADMVAGAVDELAGESAVGLSGPLIHASGHAARLPEKAGKNWKVIEPILREAGRAPPVVHDIARQIGTEAASVSSALRAAEAMGLVVRVGRNRYALPETLSELSEIARQLAHSGQLTPVAFRTEAAIGRNLAIEILEHFDRVGMTVREGDTRRLAEGVSVKQGGFQASPA
ncbi:MAG: selenocysteine-specific translation elongation factor [Rhizobiales bacterium]|nr:selenocysteine-specific translation elongation factor [Hyphomicrobiales bacterium]